MSHNRDFESYPEDSIDSTLDGELLWLITEELSPPQECFVRDDDE